MYCVPRIYGTQDYIQNVPQDVVETCIDECTVRGLCCDDDLHELLQYYMEANGWTTPVDHVLLESICT